MPLDDCFARYNHSCLLGLDDPHERIGVGSIFSSPSAAPLSKGCLEHCKIYYCSLDVPLHQLLDVVPRVMTSLVTSCVDLPFRGICHVSFSGWLYRFRCQNLLLINSGIPLLPLTFLKFSPLTFLVQCLVQKYFRVLSLPLSKAKYSPHPRSQVFLQISTCLKLSSLRLVIVQIRLQTSTMTQPVIVVQFSIHHQLPPCPKVVQSIIKFTTVFQTCLYISCQMSCHVS